jgi:hypothetical protein
VTTSRLLTITAATLIGLGSVTALPGPASAATGSVSMQAACDNQYPAQGRIAKVRTNNVYGWKCVTGSVPVADGDIDVWRQCRTQYNNPNAYGGFTNYNNPYSWYCVY